MSTNETLKYKVDVALQEIEKIKDFVDETRTRTALLNEKLDNHIKQFDKLLSQIEINNQLNERPDRWPMLIKVAVVALLFTVEPSVVKWFGKF